MTEPSEARGTAPVVQVHVDLVEFEARLLAVERRLREQEARDQLLLGVARALRRLAKALGPMLEVLQPMVESAGVSAQGSSPASAPSPVSAPPEPPSASLGSMAPSASLGSVAPSASLGSVAPSAPPTSVPSLAPPRGQSRVVEPERLAVAQAQIRKAAGAPRVHHVPSPPPPPSGRRSWLLRAARRMVARDPEAAGRLLTALIPACRLAEIEPFPCLPGPSATVARVVVRGRLRRRIAWETAQLACELPTVSALAKLVRLRASPTQLHAAGVRLDPPLALALAALAIDPLWTLGHRFTLAHLDASAVYLEVRNGARPRVSTEQPAGAVTTTVRCPADVLLPFLAGDSGVAATIEGPSPPLDLVRGWFQDATSAWSGLRP